MEKLYDVFAVETQDGHATICTLKSRVDHRLQTFACMDAFVGLKVWLCSNPFFFYLTMRATNMLMILTLLSQLNLPDEPNDFAFWQK